MKYEKKEEEKMKNKNTKKTHKLKDFFKRFYPTYRFEKVENIPFELLEKENIKLILFDMDNTLVDHKYIYSKELKNWTNIAREKNMKLYILSNSPVGKKVKKIANELGMEYQYNASKPFLKGFKIVIKDCNVPIKNIVMIGDQLFTDIWGGNRMGLKTILVKPIHKKEWIFTKIKRPIEKIVLNEYENKNRKDSEN